MTKVYESLLARKRNADSAFVVTMFVIGDAAADAPKQKAPQIRGFFSLEEKDIMEAFVSQHADTPAYAEAIDIAAHDNDQAATLVDLMKTYAYYKGDPYVQDTLDDIARRMTSILSELQEFAPELIPTSSQSEENTQGGLLLAGTVELAPLRFEKPQGDRKRAWNGMHVSDVLLVAKGGPWTWLIEQSSDRDYYDNDGNIIDDPRPPVDPVFIPTFEFGKNHTVPIGYAKSLEEAQEKIRADWVQRVKSLGIQAA